MNYDRDCLVEIAGLMFVLIGYAFDMDGLIDEAGFLYDLVWFVLFVYVYLFDSVGWWFMRFFCLSIIEYGMGWIFMFILWCVVGDGNDDDDGSMMSIFYAVFWYFEVKDDF